MRPTPPARRQTRARLSHRPRSDAGCDWRLYRRGCLFRVGNSLLQTRRRLRPKNDGATVKAAAGERRAASAFRRIYRIVATAAGGRIASEAADGRSGQRSAAHRDGGVRFRDPARAGPRYRHDQRRASAVASGGFGCLSGQCRPGRRSKRQALIPEVD